MSNTYTQIHIHSIFAVQNRISLINEKWSGELYRYLSGIIEKQNHKLISINGTSNHLHILFGMRPTQSLSDLMQDIKGSSSKWINEKMLVKGRFSWQEGYGAFSISKSQLPKIIKYIENQKEHHKRLTFVEEYKEFLQKHEINFDEKYIFKDIE